MNMPSFGLATVDTMAALKDLGEGPQPPRTHLKNGSTCLLLGYYAPGDGGGGVFRYDQALGIDDDGRVIEDDGGVIIRPANPIEGRWVRMDLRQIWAEYFGCVRAEGLTNTQRTAAMNNAANFCRTHPQKQLLHIGVGMYGFDGPLNLSDIILLGEGSKAYRDYALKVAGVGQRVYHAGVKRDDAGWS